ncbi:hypothetical protein BC830DRAFT_43441 [Chytriomyces sp. MP71]|nr:hypothetical protein BC830DRAFT_43441 [Chytriomyces sp. MP71]
MCESYQRIITQLLSMIDPSTQQLVLSDLDAISSMANGINMEIEVMQMPIFVSNGMYHTDSNTQEQRPKFPPSTLQQQQPQLADAPTVPESPTASSKPIPKSQSGRGAPSPAISVPAKRASARKEPTSNKRTATAKTVPPTAKAALPVKPVPPLIKPAAQVNLASALKLSPKGASRFRGPALPVAIPSGAGSGTADLRTAGAYGESPSTVAPRHAGPSNTFLSISSISGPSNAGLSTAPILPAAAIASALTIPSNLLADISSTIADGSTSRRTWSRIAIDTPVHSAAPSPVATALHPSVHGGDCEAAGHEGEEGCDEGAVAVAAGEEDDVRLDSSETRAGEEDLGSALAQLADAAATKKVASKDQAGRS